jgi:peptidoglycan/xylan/chitin deacetylase (PgdA/CDA1 family)
MIPCPAQYLFRFDDLCPTMSRRRWARFEQLIDEFAIKPILAVVPKNADTELVIESRDPYFWSRMRSLESAGAAIALHGFTHVCASRDGSQLPLHRFSEFAGVSQDLQRDRINSGLAILREEGLKPRLFVAPRHGFDRNTLRVLDVSGIKIISDGFARTPHLCEGLLWIPQQLWAPVSKPAGLWTICIHPNTASDALVDQLQKFLRRHDGQFTSLNRVVREFPSRALSAGEAIYEQAAIRRHLASHHLRQFLRVSQGAKATLPLTV